jgi:AbrB family looped-hinge helix DNA binding protein
LVMMGDRGRLVIPAEVRARLGLEAGAPLVLVETPHGVILTTRIQAKALVREQLRGSSLVTELLADRRAEAAAEDSR